MILERGLKRKLRAPIQSLCGFVGKEVILERGLKPTAMLYSVEMKLKVIGEPRAEVNGYHLLSFFLRLIERVNPSLAASLHLDTGHKPFTLHLLNPPRPQERLLPDGGKLERLRITLMREEIFASLADAVWHLESGTSLPLGEALVSCQGLATTPTQSPWAACSSFSGLWGEASTDTKLRLAFLSPTTFRSRGQRNILFPDPTLVFGSLLARWNDHAPTELRLSLNETDTKKVRISGYKLSTLMLDFRGYQELGFRGQAMYEVAGSITEEKIRALNALSDFAFFSGVGAKTTMGMGQCRRLNDASALPYRTRSNPAQGR